MKISAVSTITKSLPIEFFSLVNYSLLATFGYINLFVKKFKEFYKCKCCERIADYFKSQSSYLNLFIANLVK
ncbi:hypothetical protein EG353_19610 [Chryseobacterium shandongense]|uniref:Uncharacterized protein n=1 Tax=Chryseobacterium shandongense TaxID=1493872 RepID=A0ABM7BGL9_9FLAO|nr:hypothetical protein EG353_19610 [Chryseobacterium shandongense]